MQHTHTHTHLGRVLVIVDELRSIHMLRREGPHSCHIMMEGVYAYKCKLHGNVCLPLSCLCLSVYVRVRARDVCWFARKCIGKGARAFDAHRHATTRRRTRTGHFCGGIRTRRPGDTADERQSKEYCEEDQRQLGVRPIHQACEVLGKSRAMAG